jgi:hypothetical protein
MNTLTKLWLILLINNAELKTIKKKQKYLSKMKRMAEVLNLDPQFTHSHEKKRPKLPTRADKRKIHVIIALLSDWSSSNSPYSALCLTPCNGQPSNGGRPTSTSPLSSHAAQEEHAAPKKERHGQQEGNMQLQECWLAGITNEGPCPEK